MKTEPEGPLGEAVDAWIADQRVSIAHIMRVSGLARNTIMKIIEGTRRHPDVDTLRRLALGIATGPRYRDLNTAVFERCRGDLSALAGYSVAGRADDDTLLRFALLRVTGTTGQAAAWAALILEYAGLDPGEVRALGSGQAVRRRARREGAES